MLAHRSQPAVQDRLALEQLVLGQLALELEQLVLEVAQGLAQAKGPELARGFLALAAERNFVALAEGLV
jgi:hypothetical protein